MADGVQQPALWQRGGKYPYREEKEERDGRGSQWVDFLRSVTSVQQVEGRERFRERFCLDALSKVPLYAAGGRKPVSGRAMMCCWVRMSSGEEKRGYLSCLVPKYSCVTLTRWAKKWWGLGGRDLCVCVCVCIIMRVLERDSTCVWQNTVREKAWIVLFMIWSGLVWNNSLFTQTWQLCKHICLFVMCLNKEWF